MNKKHQQILQAHNNRYACKKFDKIKKISDEDFNCILESARLSPSSFGFEPWKFLLIENAELKEELKEFSWGARNSLNTASHFLIALAHKDIVPHSTHVKHIIEDVRGTTLQAATSQLEYFEIFQKNDFHLFDSKYGLSDWASKQTYIALANMMTTASFLGIDSCPIEGFDKDMADSLLSSKKIIDPNIYGISYMVGFGYRDETQPIKTRQSLEEIFEIIQ